MELERVNLSWERFQKQPFSAHGNLGVSYASWLMLLVPISKSFLIQERTWHYGPEQPRIPTKALGHSLVYSLAPLTRLLVLLRCALRCVHPFGRLLAFSLPSSRGSE